MRRVVVTGLGMVSPLASGVEETWSRLLAGQSGAGTITRFDAGHLARVRQEFLGLAGGRGPHRAGEGHDDHRRPDQRRRRNAVS